MASILEPWRTVALHFLRFQPVVGQRAAWQRTPEIS
jgi:hypothetical protein